MTIAHFTPYAAHQSTTVVVETQQQLEDAFKSLMAGDGGTIKVSAAGNPYTLSMRNMGDEDSAVLIQSADTGNPATFSALNFSNISHVTLDSVAFDHSSIGLDRSLSDFDIRVGSSDHIEFTNNIMTGTATGRMTDDASSVQGGNLAKISDSSDITFAGNEISKYFHGIALHDVTDVVVDSNDISKIQGDGIRGGGVHNTQVIGNHLHDFYGAVQTITHNDMIQFWGVNAKAENSNILIDSNILDAGEGAATQGIFIRNEHFGSGKVADGHFQNITITNNVVYNAFHHGIQISDTRNAIVDNNTVLWNQAAVSQMRPTSDMQSSAPWIYGNNNINGVFTDNVAESITLNGAELHDTNLPLNYSDPAAENFVNNHVDNYGSGLPALEMTLLPDSPYKSAYGAVIQAVATGKDKATDQSAEAPPVLIEPSYEAHNTIKVDGFTRGTNDADKFVFASSDRGDVLSRDGSDVFVLETLSSTKEHRIRNFDADDTIDISGLLNNFDAGVDVNDFVKLSTITWGANTHTYIEIDTNGTGENFQKAVILQHTTGLDLDQLIESGQLYLGGGLAPDADAAEPSFKQPEIIAEPASGQQILSDLDVETVQAGTVPFWMKEGATEVQNRLNSSSTDGGYVSSPVIERMTQDAGDDVIEMAHSFAFCNVAEIIEDILDGTSSTPDDVL